MTNKKETVVEFPSPYGVSLILIWELCSGLDSSGKMISVSLRSITHSYLRNLYLQYILHFLHFRLLTEYHSFL